jgi:biopolymer transport protein ExbD
VIRARSEAASPAVELTPMIDMVFLLLIFFLVATTFHQTEREMQVALPQAASGAPMSMALREIVINVTEQGDIIVSGRSRTPAQLREIITTAVETNSDQKVSVRGDRATAYANIVRVLDVCKASGVREPYLETVLKP